MKKLTRDLNIKKRWTVKDLTLIGVMAAVICVAAPFSIPIGPVPISLTSLVIYFIIYILGAVQGTISYLIYLLIGLIGVPVFSGFTSGPGKLFGPTGGYLVGFIPMVLIAGFFIDRYGRNFGICLIGMILGTLICYGLGTYWLAHQTGMEIRAALFSGVIPFIPGDLVKIVLAVSFAYWGV